MAWYEDLTECDYMGSTNRLAVGWLKEGKPYLIGETPKEIIERIYEFSKMPGMCVRFRGYHECDFCDFVNIELGATTIELVYKSKVYSCPALIVHYMEKHSYLPPNDFIEAILNYDHQFAMAYLEEEKINFQKSK